MRPDAAYVHYCSNETIGGVEFHWSPVHRQVPLVADASSHFLSRPLDVSKFGLIYAGAQKNVGPAGLTFVIVREDLIGQAPEGHADGDGLQAAGGRRLDAQHAGHLRHLHRRPGLQVAEGSSGGVAEMEKRNIEKAKLLYDFLDASAFYSNPVAKEDRSRMNVPFTLKDAKLDDEFLKGAAKQRHGAAQGPPLGGRHARLDLQRDAASKACNASSQYMRDFEKKHA